ncbi:uncharacterized protein LOC142491634 [Ascaphus truei]|uniref:uncharacterized protein LOC142491634 n=1 Tax=Ascaphus truei TaxID=8439 RepID=UPI003F5A624F
MPIQWPSSAESASTAPPVAVLAGLDFVPSNLSILPTMYHEFLDVFNKNESIQESPFFINFGFHLSSLPLSSPPSGIRAADSHVTTLQNSWKRILKSLQSAISRQKTKADRRRQPGPSFKPGDRVWLSSKNIRLKTPSPKLSPRFLGPFKITEKISPVAYRLALPPTMRIPSVFHVSLLKPFVQSSHFLDPSRKPNPLSTLGQQEYEIHSLIDSLAPEGHVSPETEQVSSPGSASSTHLEEHDEEDFDDDDDDDDDAAAAAIDTQIQASDHEEVPIETVLPPKRPANTTYDAIVASEGKIVEAENRRHSDLMTVLERMIALQEETVSQLAHLHRVFIEVPKQLQKINTSFEALVVQQTQANYWRMTNVPQFNTSQPGSVHAGQFSPHSSNIHSPGPNVTGQVADIAVQVPDDILPLPSVQIQQQTPTKEATKTKQDTHETDQPSLVQCLPTCSHVSVGTSPVREQSLPKSL